LYITNDEEIKEGDWVFNITQKTIFKASKQLIDLINEPNVTLTTNKKIILTTDLDLQKDGVQGIDDDFLEWFVKNPSCDVVKVELERFDIVLLKSFGKGIRYKIIIPSEESKPHSFCETPQEKCSMNYCDENGCQNRKRELAIPKKEQDKMCYHPMTERKHTSDIHFECTICGYNNY